MPQAIAKILKKVSTVGATDHKLIAKAQSRLTEALSQIQKLRDPILAEAKTAEAASDFSTAFKLYLKATQIDSQSKEGLDGMSRVRANLHDRAKAIYTEAVIAENYSDFENAQKLYKSCLEIAPSDDIYYERSTRKLARFISLPPPVDSGLPAVAPAGDPSAQPPPVSSDPGVQATPVSEVNQALAGTPVGGVEPTGGAAGDSRQVQSVTGKEQLK